jgi:hypothetical protein
MIPHFSSIRTSFRPTDRLGVQTLPAHGLSRRAGGSIACWLVQAVLALYLLPVVCVVCALGLFGALAGKILHFLAPSQGTKEGESDGR